MEGAEGAEGAEARRLLLGRAQCAMQARHWWGIAAAEQSTESLLELGNWHYFGGLRALRVGAPDAEAARGLFRAVVAPGPPASAAAAAATATTTARHLFRRNRAAAASAKFALGVLHLVGQERGGLRRNYTVARKRVGEAFALSGSGSGSGSGAGAGAGNAGAGQLAGLELAVASAIDAALALCEWVDCAAWPLGLGRAS